MMLFVIGIVFAILGYMIYVMRARQTGAIHLMEKGRPGRFLWFYFYDDGEMRITPGIRVGEKQSYNREMDSQVAFDHMDAAWKKHEGNPDFSTASLEKAKSEAAQILAEIPQFLDREFPEWEVVDAEHQLYEAVENHPHAFKGFIDGVIKAKGKRGETLHLVS